MKRPGIKISYNKFLWSHSMAQSHTMTGHVKINGVSVSLVLFNAAGARARRPRHQVNLSASSCLRAFVVKKDSLRRHKDMKNLYQKQCYKA